MSALHCISSPKQVLELHSIFTVMHSTHWCMVVKSMAYYNVVDMHNECHCAPVLRWFLHPPANKIYSKQHPMVWYKTKYAQLSDKVRMAQALYMYLYGLMLIENGHDIPEAILDTRVCINHILRIHVNILNRLPLWNPYTEGRSAMFGL